MRAGTPAFPAPWAGAWLTGPARSGPVKTLFILNDPPYGTDMEELTDWTLWADKVVVF